MTTSSDKRRMLKAAGWRRQDFAGIGERWFGPGTKAPLGVNLDTAWRSLHRKPRGVFDRISNAKAHHIRKGMQEGRTAFPEDLILRPQKK